MSKSKYLQGAEDIFSGIREDQCIIFGEQGSTRGLIEVERKKSSKSKSYTFSYQQLT